MKEYNKEKLNKYAKELFALCLKKGITMLHNTDEIDVYFNGIYHTSYLDRQLYSFIKEKNEEEECLPIWELIEKVKAL